MPACVKNHCRIVKSCKFRQHPATRHAQAGGKLPPDPEHCSGCIFRTGRPQRPIAPKYCPLGGKWAIIVHLIFDVLSIYGVPSAKCDASIKKSIRPLPKINWIFSRRKILDMLIILVQHKSVPSVCCFTQKQSCGSYPSYRFLCWSSNLFSPVGHADYYSYQTLWGYKSPLGMMYPLFFIQE